MPVGLPISGCIRLQGQFLRLKTSLTLVAESGGDHKSRFISRVETKVRSDQVHIFSSFPNCNKRLEKWLLCPIIVFTYVPNDLVG